MFKVRPYFLFTVLKVIVIGVVTSLEPAQAQFIPHDPAGFEIRHRANRNAPLKLLPEQVEYKAGEVSIVVDPDSLERDRIDVYVINDTNDDFRFHRRALGLPIVLEVDLGNGIWERAEIRNDITSYTSFKVNELVLNGHYRKRKCRHWTVGEPAKLRYSLYKDGQSVIASESFDGYLPMGTVHFARRDLMAASITPEVLQLRYQAEETSFEHVRDEWVPKLTLLHQFGPAHIELEEVQKWTADIHSNPVSTRAERDLAIRLQTKMLQPWQSKYDLDRLYEFCVQTVKDRTAETQSIRYVCWQLLHEATNETKRLIDPSLPQTAWQSLQASSGDALAAERREMARFLCSSHVTRLENPVDSVSNPEQYMQSSDPYLRIVAANWFLSRKPRSADFKVMEFYRSTPPANLELYELIEILQLNRIYNSHAARNWDLWLRAMDIDLPYTVSNLALIYDFDKRDFRKKFKASEEDFPESLKMRLLELSNSETNSEIGQLAKKILDFNRKKRSPSSRLNIKF